MTLAGSAPAIVTPARTVDRQQLDVLAEQVRGALAPVVHPGRPLGIWVDDPIDFGACAMAALALRAEAFIVLPSSPAERARELCAIEGASLLICDTARAAALGATARPTGAPGLVLVETEPAPSPRPPVQDDQGALHFYTSGTDGRPKGVRRTAASLALEESVVGSHLQMAAGRAVLCAVPITHGYGYTAGVFAPLSFGGTSIVAAPRLAASLARLLRAHQPEIVVAVPAQYAAWSALREPYHGPLPRLWLCGGAPLPTAVRARFKAAWGSVVAEQYGMTECGAVTVDLDGTETLGRPYPGVDVRIDGGDGSEAVGEVVVRAPYGPQGYLGDPARDRFTPAGFRSGDSGWIDADGRLHLVGRRAHQLNVRGRQVDPSEVERAMWSVPGMRDVAVLGVDRDEGDQWIAAFVVCDDSVADDVLRLATNGLDEYKHPQRVIRLAALPKTGAGKTDFDALRVLAAPGGTSD